MSSVSWWSSLKATWRSVLSWMHWSKRRQFRRAVLAQTDRALLREQVAQLLALETAALLDHLDSRLLQERQAQERLLYKAMVPLAEALYRMDSQHQELLLEILQGQQPPISQQLGLSIPGSLPLSSGR